MTDRQDINPQPTDRLSKPLADAVSRTDLAENGPRTVHVTADTDQCKALADRFELSAVDAMTAQVTLTAIDGPGVRIEGHIDATVVQSCVVSHRPVTERVADDFTLQLLPAARVEEVEEEMVMDPDADEVDVLDGDRVDLAEIVAQSLALALNPYPRDPAAEIPATATTLGGDPDGDAEGETKRPNPFAVLKKLKDGS
ncbi:hypothetical protein CCR85_04110 [Rhodothalassium salexigens]|uniref:YceD family protein n=1 Tax=Rhodothalassium salexigens TaxID=1086 RepID=UPI001913C58A|nr:DUF177 domain-containing protein [Rhodothalassium salexigens]MBK5910675.1 hypothetical protein [Rhodothalassium salexigens]MBK5920045.1 hypothetical protein [Rhodothalassium salexigens]